MRDKQFNPGQPVAPRKIRHTKRFYTRENLLKKQSKSRHSGEIAKELGVSKEEIAYALDAIQSPVSLYEPVYTDGGRSALRDGSAQ